MLSFNISNTPIISNKTKAIINTLILKHHTKWQTYAWPQYRGDNGERWDSIVSWKEYMLLLKGSYSVSNNHFHVINTDPVLLDLIFQYEMKI